ncbi:hypothetical protein FRC07_008466 [Ceratobasidium sp. 392]|nr:hypothetical protein FRC07_008466 [Ceratobasidium sp. 392]
MPSTRLGLHPDKPCTLQDITAVIYPKEPGSPLTERKLESVVNTAMDQFPAFGSLIKKVATLFPVKTELVEPNLSPDTSIPVDLPILSFESNVETSARTPASDFSVVEGSSSCDSSSISETTPDEDRLSTNGGSEIEMDPGGYNCDDLMFSDDHSDSLDVPTFSYGSPSMALLDYATLEAGISFELVDGSHLECVDLADVRLSDLSATEQLEPVSLVCVDMRELDSVAHAARTPMDLDLSKLIDAAFALETEEIISYSSPQFPSLVNARVETEEVVIPSTPLEAGSLRLVMSDRVHLEIGEQSNDEIVVNSVIGHGTSSDTRSESGARITYPLWTSWFPLASLAMLVGGPALCLALFFVWRCLMGSLKTEHTCSASPTGGPSMARDMTASTPTTEVTGSPSSSLPVEDMSSTAGSCSSLQLPSDGKNHLDELAPKQTADSTKMSRSKPLRTKKKRADIQPLVATRKAPPRPYRGPLVPIITITPPNDTDAAPTVCYYGPKVVPASWNSPSNARTPPPCGRRKRSNAVGAGSRAQVETLVAALSAPASSPVPESGSTPSSAPHPAIARARGTGRGHRRKQSSMSEWFEQLVEGHNPSVVIRSADLAKLASVLNSPLSSPESTPPTTPTFGSFMPHPGLDEIKSHPTVVAEVSHDGSILSAY